jgi:hypothetical protein
LIALSAVCQAQRVLAFIGEIQSAMTAGPAAHPPAPDAGDADADGGAAEPGR